MIKSISCIGCRGFSTKQIECFNIISWANGNASPSRGKRNIEALVY